MLRTMADHDAPRFPSLLDDAVAFGLPLAICATTAARTIQGGDSAEFALVGAVGGVPHPPGYPLYAMLSRIAFVLLPGPPAWRVSMLSALCGAAAAVLLRRACLRLTGDRAASLVAALAFALSPLAWKLSTVPEVFSLHALLAAALILTSLHLGASGSPRDALLLGLAGGLGLSNHLTIVLLVPMPLWALLSRPRGRRRLAGAIAIGAFAGLLPYVYLPLAGRAESPPAWVWGDFGSAAGVLHHVLRGEYGTFRLGLSDAALRPLDNAGRAVLSSALAMLACIAFAPFGVVAWKRRSPGSLAAAGLCFLLAGVLFPARFNLPDSPLARAVAERFALLPALLWTFPIAFGLAALHAILRPRVRTAASLLLFLPLAANARVLARAPVHDAVVRRFTESVLREAAPNAVILGQGDVLPAATEWVQRVEGLRPDVRYVDVNLLRVRWYYDRTVRRMPGFPAPFDAKTTHLGMLARALVDRGPVCATAEVERLLAPKVPRAQEGLLVRIAPDRRTRRLDQEEDRLRRATTALPDNTEDPWSRDFLETAARAWLTLGREAAGEGDDRRATRCIAEAQRLGTGP